MLEEQGGKIAEQCFGKCLVAVERRKINGSCGNRGDVWLFGWIMGTGKVEARIHVVVVPLVMCLLGSGLPACT